MGMQIPVGNINTNTNQNQKTQIGHTLSWENQSGKNVTISPFYILLNLIDGNIDTKYIPELWKTCKLNNEYIKIKFKNTKIIYFNKFTKKITEKIPKQKNNNDWSYNQNRNISLL